MNKTSHQDILFPLICILLALFTAVVPDLLKDAPKTIVLISAGIYLVAAIALVVHVVRGLNG